MATEPSIIKTKQPKYKKGDYIAGEKTVFLKIACVLTDDENLPIYGVTGPKSRNIVHWESQFELDEQDFGKRTPDFKSYQNLKTGDFLVIQSGKKYVKVLARVGDAVLLSGAPNDMPASTSKMATEILGQLEEVMEDIKTMEGESSSAKKYIQNMGSQNYQNKKTTSWMHVDQICLMNWPIAKD